MAVALKIYRGAIGDTRHHVRIAVCDAEGKLLYYYGDPYEVTFARSSAKPMQAIPVCESGALEKYGITDRELALMCASHSGEDFHVEAALGILKKAGMDESYLRCSPSLPMDTYAAALMLAAGKPADALHSDCSGKHSGMLLTADIYGESLSDYDKPDHPVQKRISAVVADVCDYPEEEIITAVDGCGVPVHAMPLNKLAQGYARLSKPEVFPEKRAAAVRRITSAMTAHPEMVGGTNRLCTDLMRAFGDRLFCKLGAAAFYGIGLKDEGIGIAIKIEDGSYDAIPLVALRVLEDLGAITAEEAAEKMPEYADLNVYNAAHTVVGRKEVCFHLIKAE